MTRLKDSLVENVALLTSESSKKRVKLDKCQKDHSILDKSIMKCLLWLDNPSDQAYLCWHFWRVTCCNLIKFK
jgi:hypothetical protein